MSPEQAKSILNQSERRRERETSRRSLLVAAGSFLMFCLLVGGIAWSTGVAAEIIARLKTWTQADTVTVLTGGLASMSCAVPGVFLLLRRQSMMGDALSHTVLPGIVGAFLVAHGLKASGWMSEAQYTASWHAMLFGGAIVVGVLAALLTESVQKLGNVERSAALGVVFTTLFALGLLMLRLGADQIHLDADCVLYGELETVALETIYEGGLLEGGKLPSQAIQNGVFLFLNLFLVVLLFKELRISSFDPATASAMGINAGFMHYAMMAMTAATLVAAFESVGSILVIAMLIVPAATARMLTERLWLVVVLSLVFAAAAALVGRAMAFTLPPLVFGGHKLFAAVEDASTTGMMALAGGGFFVLAVLFSPTSGVISRAWRQTQLALRIAREDILGLLYRYEERPRRPPTMDVLAKHSPGISRFFLGRAARQLRKHGDVRSASGGGLQLTPQGREQAVLLVQAHRLWESFLAEHFELPEDHLHGAAHRVEHFLTDDLRAELQADLRHPRKDPHGSEIPRSPTEESDA